MSRGELAGGERAGLIHVLNELAVLLRVTLCSSDDCCDLLDGAA